MYRSSLGFLTFFGLYTAVGIFFLLLGIGPALSKSLPAVKDTFQAWGEGGGTFTGLWSGMVEASQFSESLSRVSLDYLFSALSVGLGVFIVLQRPKEWTVRLLGMTFVGMGSEFNFQAHGALVSLSAPPWSFLSGLHLGIHAISGATYVHALLIFPNGRLAPRWSLGGIAIVYLLMAVGIAFIAVPAGIGEEESLAYDTIISSDVAFFVVAFSLLIPVVGVASQAYRYRAIYTAQERQQTKPVVWAVGVSFAAGLLFIFIAFGVNASSWAGSPGAALEELEHLVLINFPLLFTIVPLALVVSILRYRLWGMDVLINRTLVYGSLTGLLASAYFGTVVLLQLAFRGVTDQGGPAAIVISTLAIAALFQPLRRRIQALIDRRLYRRKYDAFQTLGALSTRMRAEVDLDRLKDEVLATIKNTMQPAHVSLRLMEDDVAKETGGIVTYFDNTPYAVEIDKLNFEEPAVQALKAAGVNIAVPLVSQGDLIGVIELGGRLSGQGYSTDDRKLLNDLASQAAPAVRVAQLVRDRQAETQVRERMEQELRVARVIQQTLLPKEVPSLPDWQVAAHYHPAREVGGDFYDFIDLPEGKLGFVIGDVTDKGVPAAMVMASTRSLLGPAAQRLVSPGQVLGLVNDLLLPDIPPNMFVTCLYAVLDPLSGRLRYANAGHDLPYQRTPNGVLELHATRMPLGLMLGMTYEEKETTLAPGESILFYSDGLVEAHNLSREMFGFPRLKELVAAHPGGAPLIQFLLAGLAEFSREVLEQEDDVTLVTLQRTASVASEPHGSAGNPDPTPGGDDNPRT